MDQFLENIGALLLIVCILGGTFYLAKKRGRNPWRWFFAAFFIHIFGIIFLLCSKPVQTSNADNSRPGGLKGKAFHDALTELQGVGDKTAWAVIDVYSMSNDLEGVTIDQLKRIDGVSPANAEVIKHFFG